MEGSETFESLLSSLATMIEVARRQDESSSTSVALTQQAKQELVQATNTFKTALDRAKATATNIDGGNLSLDEQDRIIAMLEQLRDAKRNQLVTFQTLAQARDSPEQPEQ